MFKLLKSLKNALTSKKDPGVKEIYKPAEKQDPRELKGTKLVDCGSQEGGCPFQNVG